MSRDNLKARLAYSTVSQLAYVVLGAALATPTGIIGGGLQIATHAAGKITLFFCAGEGAEAAGGADAQLQHARDVAADGADRVTAELVPVLLAASSTLSVAASEPEANCSRATDV